MKNKTQKKDQSQGKSQSQAKKKQEEQAPKTTETTTAKTVEPEKTKTAEQKEQTKPAVGGLSSLRFEEGVMKKFVAASVAIIILPILTIFGVYQLLTYAEVPENSLPESLAWVRKVATATNKLVVCAICGMAVVIACQVVFAIMAYNEDKERSKESQKLDKKKKNQ